jgi:hypothetical protein
MQIEFECDAIEKGGDDGNSGKMGMFEMFWIRVRIDDDDPRQLVRSLGPLPRLAD